MTTAKRSYDSAYRRELAEETRMKIATAARRLFVERGYGATTIRQIAQAAGVAEQTVYSRFTAKKGIVAAIVDQMDSEAGALELVDNVLGAAGEPRRQIALIVTFSRRLFERNLDMYEAADRAVGTDAALSSLLQEGRERGRAGRRRLLTDWRARGVMKPGLEEAPALALFMALCSPWFYRELVHEGCWTADQYEDWLNVRLCAELLTA